MCPRTVLVVEDEPLIRMMLAEALLDEGYQVIEASSALEGVAAFGQSDSIDAVITDVDMPGGLSGIDLARSILAFSSSLPILVTSGRYVATGSAGEPFEFLPKPYHLDEIIQFLTRRLTNVAGGLSDTPTRAVFSKAS